MKKHTMLLYLFHMAVAIGGWLILAMISLTSYFYLIHALLGFALNHKQVETNGPSATYCERPLKVDCAEYVIEIEKWIKNYEKAEDKYLQCNLDLSRCQDEINMDIMCIQPNCK